MPIAGGELHRQLIDRVQMAEAGGAAHKQGAVARAQHRSRWRRITAPREDGRRSRGGNVTLERAR